MNPKLQFEESQITDIAGRYGPSSDEPGLIELKTTVLRRGHLTKDDLCRVARWKAARSARHARTNAEEYISEITRLAFATDCERARIECLTVLDGVSWPTASVILHLFHRDPYPILDFRALWSVSLAVPTQYSFGLWWPYVEFCRSLAVNAKVDMRTLDRALWQYSKENQ